MDTARKAVEGGRSTGDGSGDVPRMAAADEVDGGDCERGDEEMGISGRCLCGDPECQRCFPYVDDDDGDDCCIHGIGFDEDCERCEDDEDEATLEYQAHYCA